MRSLYFLAALALLAACGANTDRPDPGYGFSEQGASGLRVRYSIAADPRIAWHEYVWEKVKGCTWLEAPAPIVIYVTDSGPYCGYDGEYINGCALLQSGRVIMENQFSNGDMTPTVPVAHEFVHWLTHWNGTLTIEQQFNHESNLFLTCVYFPVPPH